MIYITGDTHREFERIEELCNVNDTKKDDILIILGDAGINYYLDESDIALKEYLQELPVTLFCIHGNHEERPYMIDGYEEKEWHGGIVYVESGFPDLLFARDGEIYDFNGKKTIVIGGAYSVDKYYRLSGNVPWFYTEQPDEQTMSYVERQLDKCEWKIDYVFSHTAPLKYEPRDIFLPNINQETIDISTEKWLDEIENRLSYEAWFLGHYHCDRNSGRTVILFEEILELED